MTRNSRKYLILAAVMAALLAFTGTALAGPTGLFIDAATGNVGWNRMQDTGWEWLPIPGPVTVYPDDYIWTFVKDGDATIYSDTIAVAPATNPIIANVSMLSPAWSYGAPFPFGTYVLTVWTTDTYSGFLGSENFDQTPSQITLVLKPATPVIDDVTYEFDAPDGTYTINWTSSDAAPGGPVDEAMIEWDFDGGLFDYNSGWVANDGSYTTPRIDPYSFWQPVRFRVVTRDATYPLETSDYSNVQNENFSPPQPDYVNIDATGAPVWDIQWGWSVPKDMDYVRISGWVDFTGGCSPVTWDFGGFIDEDGSFIYNPVTSNPALPNIYGHPWRIAIEVHNVADYGDRSWTWAPQITLELGSTSSITMTSEKIDNPWEFRIVYNDPYNDLKWGTSGFPYGYLNTFELDFQYEGVGVAETETFVTPTSTTGVGVMNFEVDPADLTTWYGLDPFNMYNDWRVTPDIFITCGDEHHMSPLNYLDYETYCPPFAPIEGIASYYFEVSWIQVPEYDPSGIQQGVTSGETVRSTWNLPPLPTGFYGNTDYLRTDVLYEWGTPWGDFTDGNAMEYVAWDGELHERVLTSPADDVMFYLVSVRNSYDSWGADWGAGKDTYGSKNSLDEVDRFEVDDQDPGPVTDESITIDPVTETFGSPWILNFRTPDVPDFAGYLARLTKSGDPGVLWGVTTMAPPNTAQTWEISEDMWDNQIFWPIPYPFGTYNLYVDTFDNTVPDENWYNDTEPYSFDYTLFRALGNVLDLDGEPNKVSIEFLYRDRVRAGWRAVDHKPFGLDPDYIHYVAQLFYFDTATARWLEVANTDEVYPYDPTSSERIRDPRMYADFDAGDFDFPAGRYQVKVHYYYLDPLIVTIEGRGDGFSSEFNIEYEGVMIQPPTWTGSTSVSWLAPTGPELGNASYIMEYEVKFTGSNGLVHIVQGIPGATLTQAFQPGVWWPDANVYGATYKAQVRALDNIGRMSDWSLPSVVNPTLTLPPFAAISFTVVDNLGAPFPATSTKRDLFVEWAEFTTVPVGFIGTFNKDLITFQLRGWMSGDANGDLDVVAVNNGPNSIQVPVGEVGKSIGYTFDLDMFYDGELVASTPASATFTVDLKGPGAFTLPAPALNSLIDWDFNWADVSGADHYDIWINRLSGLDGAVDATYTAKGLTSSQFLNFVPSDEFADRVFGYYNYVVVAYDSLGNASPAATYAFQYLSSLAMGTVTLTNGNIAWTTTGIPAPAKFDVRLENTGTDLSKQWNNVLASPKTFNWTTDFAGLNIYGDWHAYVRAYDIDGNVTDWKESNLLTMTMPTPSLIGFTVVRLGGGSLASPIADRELKAYWTPFTTAPTGFINWDADLVTYQLDVKLGAGGTDPWYSTTAKDTTGIEGAVVPVGIPGQVTQYTFRLQAYYDNQPLTAVSALGPYTVDLEGPPAFTLNAPVKNSLTDWDFDWTDAATAVRYDIKINRLSGLDGAVDATFKATSATSNYLNFNPSTKFADRVYGYFNYEVIAYDSLGNASVAQLLAFTHLKYDLIMGAPTFIDPTISWADEPGAVKYEVELVSDEGHKNWFVDDPTLSKTVNWATDFPDANVYTTWEARVRAYDFDGNIGPWSPWTEYVKPFPEAASIAPRVCYLTGATAPKDTPMHEEELLVTWRNYDMPAGFVNWDPERVQYELIVRDSFFGEVKQLIANHVDGEHFIHTVKVQVGIPTRVTHYSFEVRVLYDGILLAEGDVQKWYVIDYKAPALPTGQTHDITGSPWEFDWVAPTDPDLAGYVFELQKWDPLTGLVINNYTMDTKETATPLGTHMEVDPLLLNWSVFGNYRWRVNAYDVFGNLSTSWPQGWFEFTYTINAALFPHDIDYELLGEGNSLEIDFIEYSNKTLARFFWDAPSVPVIGFDMEDVDYEFELYKFSEALAQWVNVKEYSLSWHPTYMESEVSVGITGETTRYKGRVRVSYRGEQSEWLYTDEFRIDLDRPTEITGVAEYESTVYEEPVWAFVWDDSSEDTVGIGGFLFILERLEGSTTHAVAMLDLPYIEAEEAEESDYSGEGFWFDNYDGVFMLEMDPFTFVESIDGIFRYRIVAYDNLGNENWPTLPEEFESEWSDGDAFGTYPFINLYDNWMGEIQDMGNVNNNTYATVSFDIFNLDDYRLEFWLNGTLLVEGVDFMLLDSPYSAPNSHLYYLVLLESVRDMIQGAGTGNLLINALVEDEDLIVQFTIDVFGYIYQNQRTGFGFGRFRPALDI